MVEKRWKLPEDAREPVDRLSREIPCSPLLAGLLERRGITDGEEAQRFLYPKLTCLHDPAELPDMDRAVSRIERAIRENESMAVFGDYDVDGVTSTCLLLDFFDLVGVPVSYRLPNRLLDGYGLRADAVRELAGEGVKLIITVDNGSSATEALQLASELGVDVVVTDHHQMPEVLPVAAAVVNPCRPDSTYPFRNLAGVGVAFKLVWALAQRLSRQKKLSDEFRNFLLDSLGLVALGTISDVVPLLDENRALAKFGLRALERARRPGLRRLVDTALGNRPSRQLLAADVAFRMGPRINAAGRLGNADAAIRLLRTSDAAEAAVLLDGLERENRRRQKIEQEILQEARQTIEEENDISRTPALVVAGEGWHPGVIGIVAARVVELYHRPTVLLSVEGDRCRGSARSIPGVSICRALEGCAPCLTSFGGHEMAAGVELERERLGEFREALQNAVEKPPEEMIPEVDVDAQVLLSDINLDVLAELALLEPHGMGNPEPLLSAEAMDVVGEPRLMGQGGQHLSFYVRQNGTVFRAVAFGKGEYYPRVARRGVRVSLLLEPRLNRWQGQTNIELRVRDLRVL